MVITLDIFWCGEFYSRLEDNLRALLTNALFINNYAKDYTLIGVASSWSSCCDIQFGLILTVFIDAVRRKSPNLDAAFRTKVVWTLLGLLGISFAFRAFVFDPVTANVVRMGEMFHFGRLIGNGWLSDLPLEDRFRREGGSALRWVEEKYNHTWLSTAPGWEIAQIYSFNLYLPMHTRYGPITIGGLLACAEQRLLSGRSSASATQSLAKYLLVGWATSQLILPMIPQDGDPTDIPLAAQFFITVFIRSLAALAGGILLLTAVLPEGHAWRLGSLADFLKFPIFTYVGTVSYCSYLLHFRILWEIILRYYRPSRPFVQAEGESVEEVMQRLQIYMVQVYLMAVATTMLLSTLMHQLVELPGLALRAKLLESLRPGYMRVKGVDGGKNGKPDENHQPAVPPNLSNGKEMDTMQMERELATVLDDLRAAEAKLFEQEVELKRLRSAGRQ